MTHVFIIMMSLRAYTEIHKNFVAACLVKVNDWEKAVHHTAKVHTHIILICRFPFLVVVNPPNRKTVRDHDLCHLFRVVCCYSCRINNYTLVVHAQARYTYFVGLSVCLCMIAVAAARWQSNRY